MLDFQRYQIAFTAHIRNPSANKKPARVADKRMAVYREIVFNNLFGAVSACFPVCQACLGKRAWRKLVREFFASHQAQSPIFREIPAQFLQFLNNQSDLVENGLPIFLKQLAHYEWVELAVAAQVTNVQVTNVQVTNAMATSKLTDLLNEAPMLAPAHMLLNYDYAVHKISAKFKPKTTEATQLLVFRNEKFQVKFIVLNPTTFKLLQLIHTQKLTGKQALTRLAAEIEYPDVAGMIAFGTEILNDLLAQQAIIGSLDPRVQ